MELTQSQAYAARGLGADAMARLSILGDLLLDAGFNVTSIREPEAIERLHFLDCLSLLDLTAVRSAQRLADLGSGAGLPALVLALALPSARVTAVESQQQEVPLHRAGCDRDGAAQRRGLLRESRGLRARQPGEGRTTLLRPGRSPPFPSSPSTPSHCSSTAAR